MKKQTYPKCTVGALVFNRKGEVLLLKSHKWKGKYTIPGGHVELGEWMESALKREVREETGLRVRSVKYICFQEFVYDKLYWKKSHCIFFDFSCRTKSRKVKLNHEAEEYVWIKPKAALKLPINPYLRRTIKEYLKSD
ncbi:MAG: NUDIX domain-containing protein [Candidatus Aenigmarchaeota archaeon]|nr:NUDIX domain-containing protein [Candidatus Aenigmarchaeota archaeon]